MPDTAYSDEFAQVLHLFPFSPDIMHLYINLTPIVFVYEIVTCLCNSIKTIFYFLVRIFFAVDHPL